ncbi:phage/plasmid primase, P4 family [Alkalicoccus saliphilus]|uniref:DNA primase n=1 Tax=Alkalicoccus saliphilus TaxID=200989 RepID=A0A2T4U2M5_9BACI|nr:DNA primase [Alkalicoccus saliphilus]
MKIPKELKDRKQWAVWKGKKIPHQINGSAASSTDPATWTTYEAAFRAADNYKGIGYFLSEEDSITVIDFDDCIQSGEIIPDAQVLVDSFNSYTEISQSGKGLHIFIKGKKPGERSKNPSKGIEVYEKKRFIAVTGNHLEGTPLAVEEQQEVLDYVYDLYFPPKAFEANNTVETDLPSSPELEDNDIISIASKAINGRKFQDLYAGNWESQSYESQSEADQALCNLIAFYTQDPEQIDRIFSGGGLYRQKWDREDYKSWTIQKAVKGLKSTYQRTSALEDFQFILKDSPEVDLQKELSDRRLVELADMEREWIADGKNGRKPTTISPLRCAVILPAYISFALFDLEENTRLAMYLPKEGIYTRNNTVVKRIISWLEPKLNSTKADDVIYHLMNRAEVKEKTESRYLIPVENGVFNLKTKQLESFSPDYVFTTKISTPYVKNISNPVIDGWDIESWLASIACNDAEVVHLLWQVINDSLNGNFSRKKAIFLIGEGNNGKGTFQELITSLIGLNNIATLKVNEFDQRFRLSVLEGKTAVVGDDVPVNVYIDDSSNFNSVVTGDVVSVEQKNKPIYNTAFKCSVIQSTNGMPKFRNKTNGTIRRLVIVPFNADFNGRTENIKIKDEYIKDPKVLQYVLHKAINMDFDKFDIPAVSLNELEVFKQDNDPVLDFKLSIFDEWDIHKVPKYIVYGFYKKFCHDNGYKPLSDRQFHKQFKAYLSSKWNTSSQGRFHGHDLIGAFGDLDLLGIGCGEKSKNYQCYENNNYASKLLE